MPIETGMLMNEGSFDTLNILQFNPISLLSIPLIIEFADFSMIISFISLRHLWKTCATLTYTFCIFIVGLIMHYSSIYDIYNQSHFHW